MESSKRLTFEIKITVIHLSSSPGGRRLCLLLRRRLPRLLGRRRRKQPRRLKAEKHFLKLLCSILPHLQDISLFDNIMREIGENI